MSDPTWVPCGRGPCAAEDGHLGTCAEASGWADPKRIQQKRTKGWRKPEGAKSVVRGTDWGNPYRVGDHIATLAGSNRPLTITPAIAVEMYRQHLAEHFGPGIYDQIRRELGGQDLMCWCKVGEPCHADLLLEIANSVHPVDPLAEIKRLRHALREAQRR